MWADLSAKYALDEAQRAVRKQFLGIAPDDEARLKDLEQCFVRIAPQFASAFYEHLLALPETARFFADGAAIEHLKQLQMHYFHGLVQGNYGRDYFETRLRVGEVHQRLGVKPTWYLAAYNLFIQECFPAFSKELGVEIPESILSLIKLILLDVGLALETYFAEATEQIRRRNAELEQALQIYFESEMRAQQYAKLAGHEIRGGLNAVGNVCEEIVEDYRDQLPAEVLSSLESARSRVWQLANVVEQILSSPDQPGRPGPIRPAELLKEVAGRMKFYAADRTVQLKLPDIDVEVWGDPVGLREVFANLVSNAVKHLDKPAGAVAIEYVPEETVHVFCVVDNGPGIPPEWQERIFQPFVQLPGSESRSGRGLGLYFVRRIVEQHGGRVWVESVPGCGSRFSFSLPKKS